MKPYYEQDGIAIYHGDCREILPQLTEKVDLVLTDPPYGIALSNHARGKERRTSPFTIAGDKDNTIGIAALEEIAAHSWPVVVFASAMKPWPGTWRQYLVWDKGPAVGGGGDPATCWKQTWELLQIARTGRLIGPRDQAVLKCWIGPQDAALHPAQKPVALLIYLLNKTGAQSILDPFMGSGSTLVAAKKLGRRCIGIEIEERYCEIAVKRLAQSVMKVEEIRVPERNRDGGLL